MKITLTKRKTSLSLKIRAMKRQEGEDLAAAVLSMAEAPGGTEALFKTLAAQGYKGLITKDAPNTKVVEVERPDATRTDSVRSDVEPQSKVREGEVGL